MNKKFADNFLEWSSYCTVKFFLQNAWCTVRFDTSTFLFLLENSILEERVLLASMFRKIFWSLNCSTFALHNVYKLS